MQNIKFQEVSSIILEDNATGGRCFNCYITIEEYIKLVGKIYSNSNEFQRKIINVNKSPIYQKLIKDLLRGGVIPTISLYLDENDNVSKEMEINEENVQILDGLQRTNCIIYALQLLIGEKSDDFNILNNNDILDIKEFNKKLIRMEIWTNLTVNGILYKMVSLNAGQTPMEIEHQLEVLELPLKKELHNKYEITIFTKNQSKERKEAFGFNISNLVEGIIAYNTESIFPKKQNTAISIMDGMEIKSNYRESTFLKNDYLMKDLVWVIDDLHRNQLAKYDRDDRVKGILSESDVFFISFMAALGSARKQLNTEEFEKKKSDLIQMLQISKLDPWNLEDYNLISEQIKSNIGQKKRKLVYTAFLMFFIQNGSVNWNAAKNFI